MRKRIFLISLCGVWLGIVGVTMKKIMEYKAVAGQAATAPLLWPVESGLPRKVQEATLVMFVHPRCPCTRASLAELARLMTPLKGRLSACIVFMQPEGFSEEWAKTDLWSNARRLPDVQTFLDPGGKQAAYFGSHTSGQVVLYASSGRLMFAGGITPSRGHEGDNFGIRQILSLVGAPVADPIQSPVFGCALDDHSKDALRPRRDLQHEHH